MNADITLNTLGYAMVYSDKDGSLRRNSTLGATKPRNLSIAHMDATDSKSKLPTHRGLIRHDATIADATGVILPVPVSVYLVCSYPTGGDATATATAISDGIVAIRQLISGTGADASALNLATAILTNHEQ
jgi:hypothetical protein